MMKFIVISHSETDGPQVEEFEKRADAYDFAEDLAAEGMASTILMNLMEVPAVEPEREDFGVMPGIDFPATLGPCLGQVKTEEQTMTQLDALTNELTAFATFEDMLNAEGGYRPSFYAEYDPRFRELADAYDKAQEERGDPRRAYRGGKW